MNQQSPIRESSKIRARKLGVLILLVVFIWAGLPSRDALALSPEEVVSRIQKKYEATKAFKADFRQEARLKTGGEEESAAGTLYFQKPSQMRWDYREPAAQKKQVIVDGREVFIYLPQDRLVMIYPLKQVLRSDLVLRLFSGMGKLQEDFAISWARPPEAAKTYRLLLKPLQPQPELKELILSIDPGSFLVTGLEFSNAYGDLTKIELARTEINPPLRPDFFRFSPPPGVEVVREKMF